MPQVNLTSNGFFDDFFLFFKTASMNAIDNLQPYILGLLLTMVVLDLVTKWDIYFGKYDFTNLVPFLIKVSFVAFFVTIWDGVLELVFGFGNEIAAIASGKDKAALQTITPSKIINIGVGNITTFVTGLFSGSGDASSAKGVYGSMVAMFDRDTSAFLSVIITILLLAIYSIFSFTYLFVQIEIFVIGAFAMILLPFSLYEHTKNVTDKILNFFFASAIRLALMGFILLLIEPVIKTAITNANSNDNLVSKELVYTIVSLFMIGYFFLKIPEYASSLLTGFISTPPSLIGAGMAAFGYAKAAANFLTPEPVSKALDSAGDALTMSGEKMTERAGAGSQSIASMHQQQATQLQTLDPTGSRKGASITNVESATITTGSGNIDINSPKGNFQIGNRASQQLDTQATSKSDNFTAGQPSSSSGGQSQASKLEPSRPVIREDVTESTSRGAHNESSHDDLRRAVKEDQLMTDTKEDKASFAEKRQILDRFKDLDANMTDKDKE